MCVCVRVCVGGWVGVRVYGGGSSTSRRLGRPRAAFSVREARAAFSVREARAAFSMRDAVADASLHVPSACAGVGG